MEQVYILEEDFKAAELIGDSFGLGLRCRLVGVVLDGRSAFELGVVCAC